MSTSPTLFDNEVIHASFRAASAEQESLDAQLSESLAALEAYQSHLDGWQQKLASERDELHLLREQIEQDRAAPQIDSLAVSQVDAELASLRRTNSELAGVLQARTEEVQQLEQRRADLATEVELARVQANELRSALEDQQRATDEERTKWEEESQRLHKLLNERADASEFAQPVAITASPPAVEPPLPAVSCRESSSSSAVLGSIVEQFGKLRQQRAMDRQGSKKTR